MCGIVGIASGRRIENQGWLTAGRDAMAHRGPDDAGLWWSADGCVGLGHRRLAIIDLSPGGHQPMQDASGRSVIVFNGEIYNYLDLQRELTALGHVFKTTSDTEVILSAYLEWGVDCLSRLNGMFAFAIYDSIRNKLVLARDRAGEKPLFYSCRNGELRFSSEVKGLLADRTVSRRVDVRALDLYLGIGYVPGDGCLVEGMSKLPPSHALSFDLDSGALRVWSYWQLPEPARPSRSSHEDAARLQDEFEALLEDAVRRQMHADVPVGVLLSGGVDSSLITAMAVRASRQVKTFTVGFSGYAKYDERPHARLIAEHFGTHHRELEAGSIAPDLLPTLARQFDEPIIDSSMIPTYLVSKLIRQHCTVALGGDGGDELFGGYAHYNRLLWTQERLRYVPRFVKESIAGAARLFLPTGAKGRNWLRSLKYDLNKELPLIASFFDVDERRLLLQSRFRPNSRYEAERLWATRMPRVDNLIERATRMEFQNYMPEDILVKVDRASMLNSLEIRAPLLDYRIIEFAFGRLPASLKTTSLARKILPKRLTAKLLPSDFDRHRKQGFSIPLAEWLKGGQWRALFTDILYDADCIFDKAAVARLLRGQDRGRNNQERLFGLVMLELWRREYKMTI